APRPARSGYPVRSARLLHLLLLRSRPPRRPPLFPYTTLFRSRSALERPLFAGAQCGERKERVGSRARSSFSSCFSRTLVLSPASVFHSQTGLPRLTNTTRPGADGSPPATSGGRFDFRVPTSPHLGEARSTARSAA